MNKPISEIYETIENPKEIKCLNLGCGKQIYNKFDNIDKIKYSGAIQTDLFEQNWQDGKYNNMFGMEFIFKKDYYGFIYSNHFFEHIPNTKSFINVMKGIFIIAKDGCIFEVRVPYPYFSLLIDLDHYRIIDVNTFKRFMSLPTKSLTTLGESFNGYLQLLKRIKKGYTFLNIKPWALHLIFRIDKHE